MPRPILHPPFSIRRRLPPGLALLISAFSLCTPTFSYAQLPLPDDFIPGASGPVYSLAVQADGRILMSASAWAGGQIRGCLGRLNADGTLDGTFNPGAGEFDSSRRVSSLVVQDDGRILVGGSFTTLGGQPRTNIGRLNADGSLDSEFNPGANGLVSCLAVQANGKILVAGNFTALGGQPRTNLARLNADGTLGGGFNPGANGSVDSLAVQADRKILVGGTFSTLGGQPRNGIARLNPDGTVDSGFNPGAGGDSPYVSSLVVQVDGKILVGGSFTTLGGQPHTNIARLNAVGTVDSEFNPEANGSVSSLAIQADGKILVGGQFTTLGGQPRNGIARLNPDGTVDSGFNPGVEGLYPYVSSLVVQADGRVLVGGVFTTLGGLARNGVARLNSTEPAIQSLSLDESTITWLRGGTSPEIWRATFDFSTNSSDWTSVGEGSQFPGGWQLSGVPLPPEGALRARGYVSGGYGNASGWFVEAYSGRPVLVSQPAGRTNGAGTVARFSVVPGGTEPLSFQWLKEGVPLTDGGDLAGAATADLRLTNVLGGDAGGYSLVVSNRLGSVTSAVARLTVIDPVIAAQPVNQVGQAGQEVTFSVTAVGTTVGCQWWKEGVALAEGIGSSLTLTNLRAGDAGNYHVVVSNQFGSVTSRVVSLRVNLATLDGGFNPGANGSVYSLALQGDGKILVGGDFTTLGGQPRTNVARLNADGTLDSEFNPGANGLVASLGLQTNGKILLGGFFNTLDGQPRACIGRLNSDGTLDAGFDPGANDYVYALMVQPDGKILVGGWFSMLGGQPRSRLGRLNADGTLDSGFTPELNGYPYSLAVQPDGKILVGGQFTSLGGQPRSYLGRLNADGTLDSGFNPGANSPVYSLVVQVDGAILVGGSFGTLGGQPRRRFGRLNPDGTVDNEFNPGADDSVFSTVLQVDGKILLGGWFSTLGGQPRRCLGRLNADGTVDSGFNPEVSAAYSLAIQADGRILVGGNFSVLAGQPRSCLARLNNTEPASQGLSHDGSTITWLRSGTSPEVWRTTFELAANGSDWIPLGEGIRIPGGWQLTGVSVPPSGTIRARGHVTGGQCNRSTWFVETLSNGSRPILLNLLREDSSVVLSWTGGQGPYQVQQTTDLRDTNSWENVGETVQTNSISLPVGAGDLFLRVRGQ